MNEIDKAIEDFETRLEGDITDFERALYSLYLKFLKEMQVLGLEALKDSSDPLILAFNLEQGFKEWYKKSLIDEIKAIQPNFDKLNEKYKTVHEKLDGKKLSSKEFSGLNFAQRELILNVAVSFKQYGIDKTLKAALTTAVNNGLSLAQTKKLILENQNATAIGVRARLKQQANDAYRQYIGSVNQKIDENYPIVGYMYSSLSLVDDSRAICTHVIKNLKGYIEKGKVTPLVRSFDKKGSGMKVGITGDEFLRNEGVYNCRHNKMGTVLTREEFGNRFKI